MSQLVTDVGPALMKGFGSHLERLGATFFQPRSGYELFRARLDDDIFIGYTSGRVVYTDSPSARQNVRIILSHLMERPRFPLTIGSDEAGKGEWLGPMTVSAVALTPEQAITLQSLGVRDSKNLSSFQIRRLANVIRRGSEASHTVLISPSRFNQLFEEVKREEKSLNDMLAWAHATAIREVLRRLDRRSEEIQIVIDEFDRFKTEFRLKRVIDPRIRVVQRPRAEGVVSVAAASVIARYEKERWIDDFSRNFKVNLRELSPQEARAHPRLVEIAKKAYIES